MRAELNRLLPACLPGTNRNGLKRKGTTLAYSSTRLTCTKTLDSLIETKKTRPLICNSFYDLACAGVKRTERILFTHNEMDR